MVYIAVINRQQENENSIYLKSYQELDIILEIIKFKKKIFLHFTDKAGLTVRAYKKNSVENTTNA